MAKRLQKYGHREVDYDRPNQKWICGHSVDGRICPLGPGARGQCRGTGECLPIRKGDRWHCTRPESQGGECENGPGSEGKCGCPLPPCQPVRSLRQVRFLVSCSAVALTIGFLFLVLGGERRDAAINPGRLTTAHAGENLDCRSCHTESSLSQLATLFDPHFLSERAVNNSRLCLDCHGEVIGDWEDSARFAHGWNGEERAGIFASGDEEDPPATPVSDTQLAVWFGSKLSARDEGIEGGMACSICHQEHHGSDASLTALTNQQCQVCHQRQFHGFDDGHPSFAEMEYPYSRRTRIYFDHEKHYQDHFKQRTKLTPGFESAWPPPDGQSCRECHEQDQEGQFMRLKGFEGSCGKCHDESYARGGNRLTLLAIPETGESDAGGNWPASGHGLIPPMRILLNGDTRQTLDSLEPVDVEADLDREATGYDKTKRRIQKEADFGELWLDAKPRRKAAEVVATDLQNFFYEVWNSGSEVLSNRIRENGFIRPESSPDLFRGLPADAVSALLFPGSGGSPAEVAFPKLDLTTLNAKLAEKRNRSVGLWPETPFPLTPVMIRLLSGRPGIEKEFRLLITKDDDNNGQYWPEKDGSVFMREDGSISLKDLSGASEAELFAVENIAWEIKEIFAGIQPEDAPLLKGLDPFQGGILDLEAPSAVLEKIFSRAKKDEDFMSGHQEELAAYREGRFPAAEKADEPNKGGKPADSGRDSDFGAPAAKPADDDFGAPAAKPADDDFGAPAAKPADDDFGAPAAKPADDDFGAPAAKPADDDFGAPAAKPADDDFGAPAAKPADDDFGAPAAKPADDNFGRAEEKEAGEKDGEQPAPRHFDVYELTDVVTWQHSGGWHYDGNAIHYASQGHADPVVRAWIEASIAAVNSDDPKVREDGRRILKHTLQWKEGVKSEASGRCLDCHTIDRNPDSGHYQVNWFGAFGTPDQSNRSTALTGFSHTKHFIALDCLQCHTPRENGDYVNFFPTSAVDPFETSDPNQFSPNFGPINEKTQCANCHQPSKAGSSCLQCHSYHVRRP